ncbi:hypothetical protein PAECIP112173_02789 [Paenibacillus sp. JJ-100]|uniref:hypothetical protein n=1 Tax=Paenibacillus sp. JJ-100 TaxID=2974896 RepID=UPI0022FF7238|nr:hypothetical protein [Paenibacillus sp. JJ-100]CAI6080123.1 hypothetical protein PAECIP112173_02789 [Paenibacillus sp. JJ-100]
MRNLGSMIVVLILSILMTSCTSTETADPSKPTNPLATEKSNEVVKDEAGEEDQRQALEMSIDFKTKDFTADGKDYEATLTQAGLSAIREETKPFLTSSYYEVYFIDRYMTLPIQVAHIEKAKLHPENIQAKIRDHKSDWIVVEYTLDLKFTDQGGKEYKSIPLWGDITFLQEEGEWRIQDDTYDMKPFTEIINNAS